MAFIYRAFVSVSHILLHCLHLISEHRGHTAFARLS